MPIRALAPLLLALVAGCQTASLEAVVPVSAHASPPLASAPVAASPAAVPAGDANVTVGAATVEPAPVLIPPPNAGPPPGDYPNLNVPMQSAAPTLTDSETRDAKVRLEAARRTNASAQPAPRDAPTPGDMRRLARERLEETVRRIEAE